MRHAKNTRRTAECVAQGVRDIERTSQHTQEDLSGRRVESKDPSEMKEWKRASQTRRAKKPTHTSTKERLRTLSEYTKQNVQVL